MEQFRRKYLCGKSPIFKKYFCEDWHHEICIDEIPERLCIKLLKYLKKHWFIR